MKLSYLLILIPALLSGHISQATEYPWSSIARACRYASEEDLHARTGCAGCADAWIGGAQCAVNEYYRGRVADPVVNACINRVQRERLKARCGDVCGDPINQVFACVQKP
jgi:hypothetical protein